jgi:AraC-like DNA-binding protein
MTDITLQRRVARICSLQPLPPWLSALVPAVAYLEMDATLGIRQVELPCELCVLTVNCAEGLIHGEAGGPWDAEVTLSTLRTRPAKFHALGYGPVVMALLTPEAVLRLFGTPMAGLTDRRLPLDRICPSTERRRLHDAVMGASHPGARMAALVEWITARLHARDHASAGEARAAKATAALLGGAWRLGMATLSDSLAVTRRQLEREFGKWLGVSPGGYGRLVRFQQAIADIADGAPIVDAAVEGGYSDQSHLTRVVRELAGVTPRELYLDVMRPEQQRVRSALGGRVLSIAEANAAVLSSMGPPPHATPSAESLLRRLWWARGVHSQPLLAFSGALAG